MARIPLSQQGQRTVTGAPVPIGSSEAARTRGEAIAQFGQNLTSFAGVAQQFDNRMRENERIASVEEASSKWRETVYKDSLRAQDTYANNPDSDGIDIYEGFMTQMRDKKEALAQSITDPEARRAFSSNADVYAQGFGEKLAALQRDRRVKNVGTKINNTVDQKLAIVRDNPAFAQQAILESENFVQSFGDDLLPADIKEAAVRALPRRAHEAAVEGMKDRGQFDQARAYLKANPMGYDKNEFEKMIDSISRAEDQRVSKDWTDNRHAKTLREEALKATQDANEAALLPKILTANADPTERAQALEQLNQLAAENKVSRTGFRLANGFSRIANKQYSDEKEMEFMVRLTNGKDMESFEKDVLDSQDNEELMPAAATRLIAKMKSSSSSVRLVDKNNLAAIDAVFKPQNGFEKLYNGQALEAQRAQAKNEYYAQKAKGRTSEEALTSVFEKFGKDSAAAVTQGVPADVVNDPVKIGERMQVLLQEHAAATQGGQSERAREIQRTLGIMQNRRNVLQKMQELQGKKPTDPQKAPTTNFWQGFMNFGAGE